MLYRFRKVLTAVLAAALISVLLAGCGKVNASATAATINGETVSAGTASTYIRFQQAETYQYQSYIYSMYGMEMEGNPLWDSDYEEDETYGEYFISQAKEDLTKMVLIRQHAADYGYSLTEEDQAAISEAAAQFVSDNGTVANWIGADQASVENMLSLYNYQTNTRDLFIADVDREVSDEEAQQSTVVYATLSKTVPDEYEGTEEEYAAEAKELMEQMLAAASAADVEEILAEEQEDETEEDVQEEAEEQTLSEIVSDEVDAYTNVAADISEDIYVSSASYSANDEEDTTFDEAVLTAARSLTDGEFYSEVIETESDYYIVKMEAVFDEDKTESQKDTIISEREENAYNDLIDSWKEAAEISYGKFFDQIKVTDKENYIVASN